MAEHQLSDSGVEVAPDNRLNWHYGDSHIGILYPGYEGAIDLYDYETDIFIYEFFTEDDIPETPPITNILIRSYGRTSVYILTTGQIQFNFGNRFCIFWRMACMPSLQTPYFTGVS